jgi:polyisoprenoid-binding protein YceI
MSKSLAVFLFATMPLGAWAAPESFTVDTTNSSVNFAVDHLDGMSTIYGRFNKYSAKFTLDRAAKTGSVEVTVETASVDSGDSDKGNRPRSRDEHLRSADFFNAAEFPRMTYKSTGVVFTGDNPTMVEGNLTLLGVTKPATLTLERFKCNPASATAKERCGGIAVGKLKRSDFGMKYGIPVNGDDVALTIGFESTKD